MMYIPSFFEPLQKLLKWEKVAIDNFVFRLHYKVTLLLFLAFVVMVTAKQHFGEPIDCHMDSSNPIQPKVMNTWCWLTGTFTNQFLSKERELECLKKHSKEICRLGHYDERIHKRIHHTYYQWVSWIIFLQALMFCLPRQLWKKMEGGKVKFITAACPSTPALNEEEEETRMKRIHQVYKKYVGMNNKYAIKFFLCEALNLWNVVVNLWLVNYFLEGRFADYGVRVFQAMLSGSDEDPMGTVFPKASMCTFDRFASGGSKIDMDNLCILSLNIINDKVYLIMWVWLHFLLLVTGLNICYRVLVLCVPVVRSYVLWQGATTGSWDTVVSVATNMPFGDWFLLRQISKNVDELTFVKFINKIAMEKEGFVLDGTHSRFSTLKLSSFSSLKKKKSSKLNEYLHLDEYLKGRGKERVDKHQTSNSPYKMNRMEDRYRAVAPCLDELEGYKLQQLTRPDSFEGYNQQPFNSAQEQDYSPIEDYYAEHSEVSSTPKYQHDGQTYPSLADPLGQCIQGRCDEIDFSQEEREVDHQQEEIQHEAKVSVDNQIQKRDQHLETQTGDQQLATQNLTGDQQ